MSEDPKDRFKKAFEAFDSLIENFRCEESITQLLGFEYQLWKKGESFRYDADGWLPTYRQLKTVCIGQFVSSEDNKAVFKTIPKSYVPADMPQSYNVTEPIAEILQLVEDSKMLHFHLIAKILMERPLSYTEKGIKYECRALYCATSADDLHNIVVQMDYLTPRLIVFAQFVVMLFNTGTPYGNAVMFTVYLAMNCKKAFLRWQYEANLLGVEVNQGTKMLVKEFLSYWRAPLERKSVQLPKLPYLAKI